MVDIKIEFVPGIFFFIISNLEVNFINEKLKWRLYTIAKIFFTTKQMKRIRKKEFAIVALDLHDETFIIYVAFLISFYLGLNVHAYLEN